MRRSGSETITASMQTFGIATHFAINSKLDVVVKKHRPLKLGPNGSNRARGGKQKSTLAALAH